MMKKKGFTLVEIMIVVAIIGLLAAIAIPSFVRARNKSRQNACINNLRQIDGAKEQAALENNWGTNVDCDVTSNANEVNEFIKGGEPECPAAGTYEYELIGVDPTCTETNGEYVHTLP